MEKWEIDAIGVLNVLLTTLIAAETAINRFDRQLEVTSSQADYNVFKSRQSFRPQV